MLHILHFIILLILVGTFIYYQKDKIVDKFKSSYAGLNTNEGFQLSNLFSLQKPSILQQSIDTSTEGLPIISLNSENDFKNEVVKYIHNFIPLKQSQSSNFTVGNLKDLNDRKIDLMITQEEIFYNAFTGKAPFMKPLTNLRFIAGLYFETFMLLTHTESGINSWKDIKGKIIGFPSKESGSFSNGYKIAQAYGFKPGTDFNYVNVDSMNRLTNLFLQKKIDAIYITTGNKNPYLINLARKMSIKFIGTNDIDESIMKAYFPCETSKYINTNNYYTNINTASFIKTFATRVVIVCHKDLDEEYVYGFTKKLIESSEELKMLSNNYLYNKDKLNLVEDAFMPSQMSYIPEKIEYHHGASKYYNELYDEFFAP
jgi:hypothetical protein